MSKVDYRNKVLPHIFTILCWCAEKGGGICVAVLNLLGEGGGLPETFFFLDFWKEIQQSDT